MWPLVMNTSFLRLRLLGGCGKPSGQEESVQLSGTGCVTTPPLLGSPKAQLCWGTGLGVGMGAGSWSLALLL